MSNCQVYLDMDGVLADFDAGAEDVIGTTNTYKWEWIHGSAAFWDRLNAAPEFFLNLPPMRDLDVLWSSVQHLSPIVLTALPKRDDHDVARQKREWISRHLGPDVPVITCLTSEKPNYCNPGDVLVDDRAVNRQLWEQRGGLYVLHTDAATSVAELHRNNIL